MSEIFLGSHLSMAAPSLYLGTCQQALSFGENAFMFYTGAPQNTRRSPLSSLKIDEGRAYLKAKGFDESKIVVHAPYIINLANPVSADIRQLAQDFLLEELKRTAAFGASLLVLHPGSCLDAAPEEGIGQLTKGLNAVLEKDATNVTICLETMAGKGHEIGRSFEELAAILSGISKQERIGFCLDTCHLNDAGYDVQDVNGVLDQVDQLLGLSRVKVIHLNDSKNERGSHKDRHENIGYGNIGFATLENWAASSRLASVPKILETPMVGEKYPYPTEIKMLRAGTMIPNWRETL